MKCLVCGKPALPNSAFCDPWHATEWRARNANDPYQVPQHYEGKIMGCAKCNKPFTWGAGKAYPMFGVVDGPFGPIVGTQYIPFCTVKCLCEYTAEAMVE